MGRAQETDEPAIVKDFLSWAVSNHIGDLSGLVGVVVSIIGFGATLVGVAKTRNSARSAERAAELTRSSIRKLDSVMDFSATLAALEEIRRLQRQRAWTILPDRYALVRKTLIGLRQSTPELTEDQQSSLQEGIVLFRTIELQLDQAGGEVSPKAQTRINRLLSEKIDELEVVLGELKAASDRDTP